MNTQNVHKVFGRHTNIGRMMHTLYNAPQERNCYEPNIELKLRASDPAKEHQLKLDKMRKEIRCKKKTVNIPKKQKSVKSIPKILLSKGRKSKQQILREMDIEYKKFQKIPIRIPSKPRHEQIDELQCLMETGIKKKKKKKDKMRQKSVDKEFEDRMSELLNEMNQRQQFLESMKQIKSKNYKKYEAQINAQIAAKWKEFKQIDALLAAES